jgi:hypothetical protein
MNSYLKSILRASFIGSQISAEYGVLGYKIFIRFIGEVLEVVSLIYRNFTTISGMAGSVGFVIVGRQRKIDPALDISETQIK